MRAYCDNSVADARSLRKEESDQCEAKGKEVGVEECLQTDRLLSLLGSMFPHVGHREAQDDWCDDHIGDTPGLFIEERFLE